jgi:hypothetical protein
MSIGITAGEVFGNWTVIGPGEKPYHLLCRCACGNLKEVRPYPLRDKKSTSCGCLRNSLLSAGKVRHGDNKRTGATTEYIAWKAMRARCSQRDHVWYPNYGGRGIRVCERWELFENFLSDMGRKPDPDFSMDRIDVNGNYEPSNCRWASDKVQSGNKQGNVHITYLGATKILSDWARDTGIHVETIRSRLKAELPLEEVFAKGTK